MSHRNHIPDTVEASLEARLAPFRRPEAQPGAIADGGERTVRLSLVKDLKLLFAALGAGGSVVPLGDNRRVARMLAGYAESLRDH